MLSVYDIKEKIKLISSPYPVFWVAQYQDGYDKTLKIPKCNKCGSLIKVLDYSNIVCNNKIDDNGTMVLCGEKSDFSWEIHDLDDGLLTEYDINGEETLDFHVIPNDRMSFLYLYLRTKDQLLGIDLSNGEFIIDGVMIGTGVVVNRNPIAVSNQLSQYNEELFHFKSAIAKIGHSHGRLLWYKIGYRCELKQAFTVMMICIHIPTLHPYFFSEYHPK